MGESKVFYKRFKQARTDLDLTQKELADRAGVTENIIKYIETGRGGTSLENFKSLAVSLNVPVEEIYREEYRETFAMPILNSKGGCSKTTICQNLSYELSSKGFKVLMVDSDLQCNLSYTYNFDFSSPYNLYNAIVKSTNEEPVNIFEYIQKTEYENLDIIGNVFDMANIDDKFWIKSFKEVIMKNMFTPLIEEGLYDFIIFDCNPNLGITNMNILLFADTIIIPVELSSFGVMGMTVLMKFIEKCKKSNAKLSVLGLLRANVDKRYSINKTTSGQLSYLCKEYDVKLFKNYISTDSNVGKSQMEQVPLGKYIKKSRAKEDFVRFANEVAERLGKISE
jgi:chromosome partitioning protein